MGKIYKYVITGGNELNGDVNISGAKNAALPIIAASVLADEPVRLENVPDIRDVNSMIKILEYLGSKITRPENEKGVIIIDNSEVKPAPIPEELSQRLRASYYMIGALLAKFGEACVPLPGGCYFGERPIDQHLKGFEALGSAIKIEGGIVTAQCTNPKGAGITFDVTSVGATINVMLAAVTADGTTVLENVAKEPHIVDVALFLNSIGADIKEAGTNRIKIKGVNKFHGTTYSIIPDQIEAGTFMTAVAATGGNIRLHNVISKHLESITNKLEECGVSVIEDEDSNSIRVFRSTSTPLKSVKVITAPHPGFPTDMQPQIVTLLTSCEGQSIVEESVWDSRFQYVDQIKRMGADIIVNGKSAVISKKVPLKGASVTATDLRAGAALVVAGLMAEGQTTIDNIKLIDRGYENLVEKFSALGADIKKVEFEED